MSNPLHHCRLEWGRRGARAAAARGDILVVVDTLSFSTTAVTAVNRGVYLYPCADGEDPQAFAARVGGEVAVHRNDVPDKGRFSLSPIPFLAAEPGVKVVLNSPNGATCSRYARDLPWVFVGALVNAEATAAAVMEVLDETGGSVTVLACGERWETPSEDGDLRFALEDYLGAGAILSSLTCSKSPDAQVCEAGFRHAHDRLEELLRECESGRELREKGYPEDVRHAARLDLYDNVPVMRVERLEKYGSEVRAG